MTAPGPSSLVTVILPVWRDERFVEVALRSVVDQDHEALEVIVVDDGTQHPAAGAIRSVLERENVRQRFRRTLHVEERGCRRACDAINRGLRESRGDYINVLEPSDAFPARRLSRLLGACAESGTELAFARVEPRADTRAAALSSLAESIYCVQDDIEFFPTVGYALLKSHCTVAAGNLLFSRRLAEHVDGFGGQEYFYGWDFALRSLLVAEPVFVPEPLLVHRLPGAEDRPERQKRTAREIESILKNYLFLCRNRRVLNPLAPSPAWGPFFESFVQTSHYTRYLAQP